MDKLNDEYALCINQISKLIDRRQLVTATYLSVSTAVIAGVAFLFKDGHLSGWQQEVSVTTLLFSGAVACNIWRRLINQYNILLDWWYRQLRFIEKDFSTKEKLFTKEYNDLYANRHKRPFGLTRYENYLTWLFTAIYIIFAIAILLSLFSIV